MEKPRKDERSNLLRIVFTSVDGRVLSRGSCAEVCLAPKRGCVCVEGSDAM